MYDSSEYQFLRHEACPVCGSSNNVGVWKHIASGNETKYCFSPECSNRVATHDVVHKQPGHSLTQESLDYLKVDAITAKRYRLTSENGKLYFGYADAKGKLQRYKVRDYSVPKTHDGHFKWDKKGACNLLYGMDACTNKSGTLILTFGEKDAIAAHLMTGFCSVSVPNGDDGALNSVRENYAWLKQFRVIYICGDNDPSGMTASERVQGVLGFRSRIVTLPNYAVLNEDGSVTELKDPYDYHYYGFQSQFKDALAVADNTNTTYVWGTDLESLAIDYAVSGLRKGYSTGVPELDKLCPLRPHEWTLVFGAPGKGKSSLARFLVSVMADHNIRPYYISYEESPAPIVFKLIPLVTHDRIYYSEDGVITNPPHEIRHMVQRLRDKVSIARLDDSSADTLQDAIECAYISHGCQFVVIDHITWLLDNTNEPAIEGKKILHRINDLVKQFPIHIFVVSHNQRKQEPKLARGKSPPHDWEEYTEPTLRDAQWTSGLEQLAFNIWGLKNPDNPDEPVRLFLLKNRTGGKKGMGRVLLYYQEDGRFLGVHDAKNKGDQSHSVHRRDIDQGGQHPGETSGGNVLPAHPPLSPYLHSVPEPSREGEQHRGTPTTGYSHGSKGQESPGDDRGTQDPDETVHPD